MKRLLLCILLLSAAACGKKEWPQPVASEELIQINHMEARYDQGCILINAKLGGRLANLEYFLVEIEQEGCPTCPFTPSYTQKFFPYSAGLYRKENSFIFTICEPLPGKTLRIRLKADNTYHIIQPALSEIITLEPSTP
ncbi:hypothetical protein [Desulfomicrobium escambiense]|uniref:hypothetical protein n=1 Tax=Desulfomicrobium escambiense TaxID=29503 RepID=UPI00040941BE|nr:hypothetical protein [Desulfomicrobium escambiense]